MGAISTEYLRSQRDRPAVLKADLARIRSANRCALVFVLEGDDDLQVYDVWLRRIDDVDWEPLVANGKANALEFREMLDRDRTGLKACTYFIVDHDYDGLRGKAPGQDVYVLPAYSVENILVRSNVVDALLRTELRVLGDSDLRKRILGMYEAALESFAGLMQPGCELLYGAKGQNVGGVNPHDGAIAGVAISADAVVVVDQERLNRLVTVDSAVPQERIDAAKAFFASCTLADWIRGKFLHIFLKHWFVVVYNDKRSDSPKLFPESSPGLKLSPASLDFRNLAAKSSIPDGLADFVRAAFQECDAQCA